MSSSRDLPADRELAISIRGVSKKFRLFSSPTQRLAEALHPFRKRYHHEFTALDDVSFDIRKGEVVGLVGRNGSGKSTLLQIICGVMKPSVGEVHANGRISALLELGAGFNPEFTGRENVYLNGTIMGFSRPEMAQRMPEIEAFADVGEFFDQPVKTYSSGMFVRVAFAAAIHIDPEILIVDEALSVGDAKFQHKCYSRIEGFRAAGKTILLVTHDIAQITAHCSRAVLLDQGRLLMDGSPRDVVDKYIEVIFQDDVAHNQASASASDSQNADVLTGRGLDPMIFGSTIRLEERGGYCRDEARYGDRSAEIVDCIIEADGVVDPPQVAAGDEISVSLKIRFEKAMIPIYGFSIKTVNGIEIYGSNTFMQQTVTSEARAGETVIASFSFKAPIRPGEYFIDLGVAERDGTPGGSAADVRRSAMMIRMISRPKASKFDGLVDLSPQFQLLRHSAAVSPSVGVAG